MKEYKYNTFFLLGSTFMCLLILFITSEEEYLTIVSIFIPLLLGTAINYDLRKKEIYKEYYEPLYMYIRTFQDILAQPESRDNIKKKYSMISQLSRDMIKFLKENVKYASEDALAELEMFNIFEYENFNEKNEIQDVYNLNRLIPILCEEVIENYNMIYFNHYILRKFYFKQNKYHKSFGLIYTYVDSVFIDIGRKKEIAIDIDELTLFYQKINEYRKRNPKRYFDIYKYIRKNRNKDLDELIDNLNSRFDINFLK